MLMSEARKVSVPNAISNDQQLVEVVERVVSLQNGAPGKQTVTIEWLKRVLSGGLTNFAEGFVGQS